MCFISKSYFLSISFFNLGLSTFHEHPHTNGREHSNVSEKKYINYWKHRQKSLM